MVENTVMTHRMKCSYNSSATYSKYLLLVLDNMPNVNMVLWKYYFQDRSGGKWVMQEIPWWWETGRVINSKRLYEHWEGYVLFLWVFW